PGLLELDLLILEEEAVRRQMEDVGRPNLLEPTVEGPSAEPGLDPECPATRSPSTRVPGSGPKDILLPCNLAERRPGTAPASCPARGWPGGGDPAGATTSFSTARRPNSRLQNLRRGAGLASSDRSGRAAGNSTPRSKSGSAITSGGVPAAFLLAG